MKNFGAKNQLECDGSVDRMENSTDQHDQSRSTSCGDDAHECLSTEEIEMIDIINDLDKAVPLKFKAFREPRAIFSKKFTENPLNDERFFHQNKRIVLYKTEMCRGFSEVGYCKYGDRCQFCHSPDELRTVKRHPKYKTEICKTFWSEGSCPYGSRCCFIHLEKKQKPVFKMSHIDGPEAANSYQLCANGKMVQVSTLIVSKQRTDRHAEKRPSTKKGFEKNRELMNDMCLPSLVPQSSIKSEKSSGVLNIIFPHNLDIMKAARALEADRVHDFVDSEKFSGNINGYNGIFSTVRSIDDIQIERVDVWAKNYIRKWNDNPVFYIFDSKYSKMYC